MRDGGLPYSQQQSHRVNHIHADNMGIEFSLNLGECRVEFVDGAGHWIQQVGMVAGHIVQVCSVHTSCGHCICVCIYSAYLHLRLFRVLAFAFIPRTVFVTVINHRSGRMPSTHRCLSSQTSTFHFSLANTIAEPEARCEHGARIWGHLHTQPALYTSL